MEQLTKDTLQHLAATRPAGRLIDGGHMHLGSTVLEFTRIEVEADIETCGDGNLRILIYAGRQLQFTTRLQRIGQLWYIANKHAALHRNNKTIYLGEMKFRTPQEFATFYHQSIFIKGTKRIVPEATR